MGLLLFVGVGFLITQEKILSFKEITPKNLSINRETGVQTNYPIAMTSDTISISGTVFVDVNYGGGSGRNFSTAEKSAINSGFPIDGGNNATGIAWAVVELYSYDGNDPRNSKLIGYTQTNEDGFYLFEQDSEGKKLPAGDYLIRVVNESVKSNRKASASEYFRVMPVQTFRNDPDETVTEVANEVGGAHPALEDLYPNYGYETFYEYWEWEDEAIASIVPLGVAMKEDIYGYPSNADPIPADAQSVTAITGSGEILDADFGFNFDTIVNTNDSGQGSLKQFTENSSNLYNDYLSQDLPAAITAPLDSNGNPVTLTDYETSIFMIPDPNFDSRVTAGTDTGQINLTNNPPDGGSGSAFVIGISGDLRLYDDTHTSLDGRTQAVNTPSVRNFAKKTIGSNETTGSEIILNSPGTNLIRVQDSYQIVHSLGITSQENTDSSFGIRISENGNDGSQVVGTENIIIEELTIANVNCGIQGARMTKSVIRKSIIRDSNSSQMKCNSIQLRSRSEENLIEDNLVLRSAHYGIHLIRDNNSNNTIKGNTIAGNGIITTSSRRRVEEKGGIMLHEGANTTIVSNNIYENKGNGITIAISRSNWQASHGNKITRNSIYNNEKLGIDLDARPPLRGSLLNDGGDGVTLNDEGDGDNSGGNTLQNYPEITNVLTTDNNDDDIDSNDTIVIEGQLQSTPNSQFRIELFSNAVCNPDRNGEEQSDIYGEGERFYESVIVNTDGNGLATFSSNPVVRSNLAGNVITATATNTASNNTSEFSQCPQTNFPDLLLVKRITAINRGQSDERLFTNFADDDTEHDNNPRWSEVNNNNTSSYLIGAINVDQVRPEDEVEYTIYFLNDGSETAQNVLICDLIPEHTELILNSFNSEPPAEDGLPGATKGLLWQYDSETAESLTNANDGDNGYYFPPGVNPADVDVLNNIQCGNSSSNTNGAVVVFLEILPPLTSPGSPSNSYGFFRFTVKVD